MKALITITILLACCTLLNANYCFESLQALSTKFVAIQQKASQGQQISAQMVQDVFDSMQGFFDCANINIQLPAYMPTDHQQCVQDMEEIANLTYQIHVDMIKGEMVKLAKDNAELAVVTAQSMIDCCPMETVAKWQQQYGGCMSDMWKMYQDMVQMFADMMKGDFIKMTKEMIVTMDEGIKAMKDCMTEQDARFNIKGFLHD